eukprot:1159919-Pelagomonas_calceolata.AAC.2
MPGSHLCCVPSANSKALSRFGYAPAYAYAQPAGGVRARFLYSQQIAAVDAAAAAAAVSGVELAGAAGHAGFERQGTRAHSGAGVGGVSDRSGALARVCC